MALQAKTRGFAMGRFFQFYSRNMDVTFSVGEKYENYEEICESLTSCLASKNFRLAIGIVVAFVSNNI